ncbi:g5384 [Coccomyxa elongata]
MEARVFEPIASVDSADWTGSRASAVCEICEVVEGLSISRFGVWKGWDVSPILQGSSFRLQPSLFCSSARRPHPWLLLLRVDEGGTGGEGGGTGEDGGDEGPGRPLPTFLPPDL